MKKFIIFSLVGLAVAGCVRTEEHARGSDEGGFAVKNAQEYFEQNAEEFNLPGLLSGQAQDGTRAEGLPETSLTPDWNEASSYKAYGVEVVDVPILSNVEQKIRRHDRQPDEAARLYEPGIESRLVMVSAGDHEGHEGHNHADAEAEDEVRMFVVTMVPDWGAQFEKATETRFLHPENDFSGLMFFSELDGTLGETWEFREGKRTRQMHAHLKSELTTEEYRAMTESVDLTAGISLPRTALTRNSEEDCEYCYPGYTCIAHTTHEVDEVVVTPDPEPCSYCGSYDCGGNCEFFLCNICHNDPCTCWNCFFCGSPYCFGGCQYDLNYSDGGGGSGSGDWGGDNDPPTQQEQKPTNPSTTNDNGYKIDEALSNVTKRKLEKNITENINGEILDRLKSRPINIKVIPDLSSGAGIYLPSSNTLILTDINDISTMREEFFHAYQNRVYTGGIDQYQHSAAGNIEFEAKLYCDLEDAFRNNDEPIGVFIYNWDAKSMQMYINCLQEATHGWNRDQPVDWDRIVREYAYFVHKFVEYGAGRYAGHSIGGVKLDAIKNIF